MIDQRLVENLHRQLLVLTMALVGGVVTFSGIVGAMAAGRDVDAAGLEPAVRLALAIGGAAVLVGAAIVGRLLIDAPGDPDPESIAGRIRTGVIVSMAMRESVGLMGGVVGLLTGDYLLMAGLAAGSAATMVLGMPGRTAIEEKLRRAGR